MIHVHQLGVVNSIKAKFPHHQLCENEVGQSNKLLIDLMIKQREMHEARIQKLESDINHLKRIVLPRFDQIDRNNSEILNTLRGMILETPSRESPKKRLRLTEVSNEQNIPEQLSIERSR